MEDNIYEIIYTPSPNNDEIDTFCADYLRYVRLGMMVQALYTEVMLLNTYADLSDTQKLLKVELRRVIEGYMRGETTAEEIEEIYSILFLDEACEMSNFTGEIEEE